MESGAFDSGAVDSGALGIGAIDMGVVDIGAVEIGGRPTAPGAVRGENPLGCAGDIAAREGTLPNEPPA
jgi:hypothetical protein